MYVLPDGHTGVPKGSRCRCWDEASRCSTCHGSGVLRGSSLPLGSPSRRGALGTTLLGRLTHDLPSSSARPGTVAPGGCNSESTKVLSCCRGNRKVHYAGV